MRFIPTYCDVCSASTLTAATSISDGHTQCLDCGGDARAIPGLSYGEEDCALYDMLAHAMHKAGLTPLHAEQLLPQIDAASRSSSPGNALRGLARCLPSLAELPPSVAERGYALEKSGSMLLALLSAHATGHRESGIMPAVSAVSLDEPLRRVSRKRRQAGA